MRRRIIGLAAAALLFYSCGGNSEDAKAGGQEKGTILAKVDGAVLTYEELQYQFPPEVRDQLRGADLQEAVETWINTMVLAKKGREMNLEKDPEVRAMMEFRRADAIARRVVELEVSQKTSVSQAEIDSAYNAEMAKETFRASHILVETRDEAEAIHNRLQKGADFAKMAADYSADRQSAASAGDIGFFAADQVDTSFARAVMAMKVGEISKPIQTDYGFHIIKLTDRRAGGTGLADPSEVKGRISEMLLGNRQGEAFGSYLESLKKKANIERYPAPELNFQVVPGTP